MSIRGIEGLRDAAVCFTTRGIYIISGLASNLTDADGNVQHRIDRYSREGSLWGDAGIAGSEGGLICPMRGGVWIINLGIASEAVQAYQMISGPIADLYKSYVEAGYSPGGAAVYRSHYILPILSTPTAPVGGHAGLQARHEGHALDARGRDRARGSGGWRRTCRRARCTRRAPAGGSTAELVRRGRFDGCGRHRGVVPAADPGHGGGPAQELDREAARRVRADRLRGDGDAGLR